jgi:hypothetical protein
MLVIGYIVLLAGDEIMHVYLRWYANGQPQGSPQRMADENEARSAVLLRYPTATFGPRRSTLHEPNTMTLTSIDEMCYAYSGPQDPGVQPIADILFPAA